MVERFKEAIASPVVVPLRPYDPYADPVKRAADAAEKKLRQ